MTELPRNPSAWEPLRDRLFLSLWLASIGSNLGTWAREVGQAWLMTSLAPTPLMVALVQTVESLTIFVLALPGGALADAMNRRVLLLLTECLMLVAAAGLGFTTLAGLTDPKVLLLFVAAMGVGAALNTPAWYSIIPEIVPPQQLAAAVTLHHVAVNLARVVGPAVGGLVVSISGPATAFLLNAVSFLGVIVVLYRWRRPATAMAPRSPDALRAGLRYVRQSPPFRAVLVRVGLFTGCAVAVSASLPLVARQNFGLGGIGYGMLLGSLGAGAVASAYCLPALRQRVSPDKLVAGATILFSVAIATLAAANWIGLLYAAMVACGAASTAAMSSFLLAAQLAVPASIRGRTLAVYLVVVHGSAALGSALWGFYGEQVGIRLELMTAAAGLLAGLPAVLCFPLVHGSPEHSYRSREDER